MSRRIDEMFAPALKRTLADDVVDAIRGAILNGRLAPGEQLSEQVLARSLNVSRGPIREALVHLEREGLVITQHHRRAFVARLSHEDLEEVYSLRMALEMLAVQQAVEHADTADLAEMQGIVDTMFSHNGMSISEQDAAEADIRLHDAIYRASKNKRLVRIWSDLRPQIHILLLSRNVANPDFREVAAKTHQAIVNAIRSRDEKTALTLTQTHLRASYDRIVASYGPSS